jgi:hypothetical protein
VAPTVATRHYRVAVLSNDRYADIGIRPIGRNTNRALIEILRNRFGSRNYAAEELRVGRRVPVRRIWL